MPDPVLAPVDAAMLRRIASPEVAGVPGALGNAQLGALLAAGLATFGFKPAGDGSSPCARQAWVAPTVAGLAWLKANSA